MMHCCGSIIFPIIVSLFADLGNIFAKSKFVFVWSKNVTQQIQNYFGRTSCVSICFLASPRVSNIRNIVFLQCYFQECFPTLGNMTKPWQESTFLQQCLVVCSIKAFVTLWSQSWLIGNAPFYRFFAIWKYIKVKETISERQKGDRCLFCKKRNCPTKTANGTV